MGLEIPFHTKAWATFEATCRAEVVGQLYLATNAKVLAAKVLAYVIPKLRLREEHGVLGVAAVFAIVYAVCLPPEVGKAVKLQTLNAEDVVTSPNGCKLHGHVLSFLANGFVEGFEGERVLECLVVYEIFYTKEPSVVDGVGGIDATVIFNVQAPVLQTRVLPEVKGA